MSKNSVSSEVKTEETTASVVTVETLLPGQPSAPVGAPLPEQPSAPESPLAWGQLPVQMPQDFPTRPAPEFDVLQRPGGLGVMLFNPKTLRSAREADDKIGFACFYGGTNGEDALWRGKVATEKEVFSYLRAERGTA